MRRKAKRIAKHHDIMPTKPSKRLETFPNPNPERDYEISFEAPEFTCLCPMTGQPDFATMRISYVPDKKCVELKSLKLYLWSFRDEGTFHEAVTNRILGDLVDALDPRRVSVEGDFFVRGGIHTRVLVEHVQRPKGRGRPRPKARGPRPKARGPRPKARGPRSDQVRRRQENTAGVRR